METYCVSRKKNITNKNSSVRRTKHNRLMLVSDYDICGKNKSRFIKNQGANELMSILGIRASLSSISLITDILF